MQHSASDEVVYFEEEVLCVDVERDTLNAQVSVENVLVRKLPPFCAKLELVKSPAPGVVRSIKFGNSCGRLRVCALMATTFFFISIPRTGNCP